MWLAQPPNPVAGHPRPLRDLAAYCSSVRATRMVDTKRSK